jgi:hypothetical protein
VDRSTIHFFAALTGAGRLTIHFFAAQVEFPVPFLPQREWDAGLIDLGKPGPELSKLYWKWVISTIRMAIARQPSRVGIRF